MDPETQVDAPVEVPEAAPEVVVEVPVEETPSEDAPAVIDDGKIAPAPALQMGGFLPQDRAIVIN